MFALPGLLALILVEYMRPQEYLPALQSVPLLHAATALAVMGFVVDVVFGKSRPRAAPHLKLAVLFFLWCVGTVALRASDQLPRVTALLIPFTIYLLVAHGIQSFRTLQVVCGLLLGIALTLSSIGIDQAQAPYGCHRVALEDDNVVYLYDGRPCVPEERRECENEDAEPGSDYVCEKVGPLGTSTVKGRVRWRGSLEDPNELSLVLGIALPLAFAFYDRRRSFARLLLLVASLAMVGLCAVYTQSRGGQLIFLTVLAVYFVNRVGVKRGLAMGVVLALPLLLYGGRSGAEDSTIERTECWWVGLKLFFGSPVFGVGAGQFLEHHYLTAHNSYILAAAELGFPGLLLWCSVVYLAAKIPVQALRQHVEGPARSWALALLASMAGLLVGVFFLSFVYKDVLWLYLGLSGMLYQSIKQEHPDFTITLRAREVAGIAAFALAVLVALAGYSGWKVGWS